MPERTPWWLLLLRMLALAAAILAFAGPVLNPRPEGSDDPLLVLIDGGWGDAPDWARRMDRAAARARRGGARRPAGGGGDHGDAAARRGRRCPGGRRRSGASGWRGSRPAAWAPDRAAWAAWLAARDGAFETLWLSDGIGARRRGGAGAGAARPRAGHAGGAAADRAGADPAAAGGGRVPRERAARGQRRAAAGRRGGARAGPERHRAGARLGHRRVRRRRGRARPVARPAGRAAQPGRRGCSSPTGARRRAWCWPTIRCGGARSG